MYGAAYDTYLKAGVEKTREVPVYQDIHGNIVPEDKKLGEVIDIEMLFPEYELFANKTGLTTLSKDDGNKGGTKFVVTKSYLLLMISGIKVITE